MFPKVGSVVVTFLLIELFSLLISSKAQAAIVFSISNPVANSDDEIEVTATISGLISSSCSTSGCYLQAELQSAGGYFGYTQNNSGEYVDYFRTPSSIDEIKTKLYNFLPVGGYWTGKLKVKNNSSSENYYGPGDYLLSFRRFSGNSLSPTSTDSNSVPVSLSLAAITPTPENTPEITTIPTPTPISFTLKTAPASAVVLPSPTIIPKSTPTKTPKPSPGKTPGAEESTSSVSGVLGIQSNITNSPTPFDTAENKKISFLPFILVFAGLCFIAIPIFSIIRNGQKGTETNKPLGSSDSMGGNDL